MLHVGRRTSAQIMPPPWPQTGEHGEPQSVHSWPPQSSPGLQRSAQHAGSCHRTPFLTAMVQFPVSSTHNHACFCILCVVSVSRLCARDVGFERTGAKQSAPGGQQPLHSPAPPPPPTVKVTIWWGGAR